MWQQLINSSKITLNKLIFNHAAGATFDADLTIIEERILPEGRSSMILSRTRTPTANLLSGQGRYGMADAVPTPTTVIIC